MTKKPAAKIAKGRQCAALPFKEEDTETMVMLVTSRETGRWVLPKGWPEKGVTLADQAAREAFEEAGIIGIPEQSSVGSYAYTKQLGVAGQWTAMSRSSRCA